MAGEDRLQHPDQVGAQSTISHFPEGEFSGIPRTPFRYFDPPIEKVSSGSSLDSVRNALTGYLNRGTLRMAFQYVL